MKSIGRFLFFLVIPVVLLTNCNDDEPTPQYNSINDWIYEEMSFWYFWASTLPDNPDYSLSPGAFYESLLNTADRFSFYSENYEELINRLKGISLESGFEFKLYRTAEGSNDLFMQISYIKKGSPADRLGLRRGDIIDKINDTQFTISNYRTLLANMNSAYSIVYRRYDFDQEIFKEQAPVNLIPITFAENPILLDSVYEQDGKKIGYLVYNFFSPGPSSSSDEYDKQLEEAFLTFKDHGIEEFILDLRYNSGGSEISARNLASLIVKNASPGSLMFKKQYNSVVEKAFIKEYGEDILNIRFTEESGNIGQNLSSGTVYVITSDRSASASEVVINSLKPYMNVFIVGETTVGKDAGSVTLYDDDNPDNTWAIQPIVVKLVNSAGEDYPNGFAPDIEQKDNFLVLQPLGSIDEPLLSISLAAASGGPVRLGAVESFGQKPIHYSIDNRAVSNKFLLEEVLK